MLFDLIDHRLPEAFLGYPAATQAGTLMSRFETILNLIAACQLHHKTGASASGGDPHPPDFLKHAQKVRLRRDAHGSIRVQEGQPRNSLILINILLTYSRAGFEPGPSLDRGEHVP
jgi:hypothetical protein